MASELVVRFMLAAAVEIRARTNALGVILSFPKVSFAKTQYGKGALCFIQMEKKKYLFLSRFLCMF